MSKEILRDGDIESLRNQMRDEGRPIKSNTIRKEGREQHYTVRKDGRVRTVSVEND